MERFAGKTVPNGALERTRRLWPLALLAGFCLVLFWDALLLGKTVCMRDMVFKFQPWRELAAQAFRDGAVPLWNHFSACGNPFLSSPQSAVYYPLHLPFSFLPAGPAVTCALVLHLFIAAAGCYGLARVWRLRTAPALVIALSYAFSTHFIAAMEFLSLFNTAAWTPVILLIVAHFIERRRNSRGKRRQWPRDLLSCLALTAAISISYLAGYPQYLQFSLLMTFAYLLARCLSLRDWRLLGASLAMFVGAGTLALGLVAPQFLMTLELIGHSIRQASFDPHLEMASMHPAHLLNLLMPFLFGGPGWPARYWARTIFEFWVGTCYIGIIPLIMISFSPMALFKQRPQEVDGPPARFLVLFWSSILLFGFAMSAGQYLPVLPKPGSETWLSFYELFSRTVPGFGQHRWPSKYLNLCVFALAMLAGIGFDLLRRRMDPVPSRLGRWPLVAGGGWLLLLMLMACGDFWVRKSRTAFLWLSGGTFPDLPGQFGSLIVDYRLAMLFIGSGIVLVAVYVSFRRHRRWLETLLIVTLFINLFIIGRQIHPVIDTDIYAYQPTWLTAKLSTASHPRIQSMYHAREQWTYGRREVELFKWCKEAAVGESPTPLGISHLHTGVSLPLARAPQVRNERLADIMGIQFALHGPPFIQIAADPDIDDIQWLHRPTALPRALLVNRWRVVDNDRKAETVLDEPSFDPHESAVLQAPAPAAPALERSDGAGEIHDIRYEWNRVTVDVSTPHPALLVLSDSWYPGWRATVGGELRTIHRANIMYRGVIVDPGESSVRFVYDPPRYRLGLVISGITMIVMGLLAAAAGIVMLRFRISREPHA